MRHLNECLEGLFGCRQFRLGRSQSGANLVAVFAQRSEALVGRSRRSNGGLRDFGCGFARLLDNFEIGFGA